MVETFSRRSDSTTFLEYFKNVGLVFIDEAHRTDFNKILQHFENSLIIGLTATPISSDKKKPLNTIWDVMYEAAKVSDLQRLNLENPKIGVVPSDCYNLGGIDRDRLAKKGNEFDEKKMSVDFRDDKQKSNTITHYLELGKNMKGLCFNVDIKHNEEMDSEFKNIGVPSRQLHSDSKKWYGAPSLSLMKNWRKDTLNWLRNTPGAIVNNVGILTTGFDEPSVELIIENFSTLSISKHIQCIVRGARPFQYPNGEWKEFYRLLDFGKNCSYFSSDGNNDINWKEYFDSPLSRKNIDKAGGYKTCPKCGSLNTVASRYCSGLKEDWLSGEMLECGFAFPFEEKKEDLVPRVMVKYFTDGINVSDLLAYARINGMKEGIVYWKILDAVSALGKKHFGIFLLEEQFDFLLDVCFRKLKELSKVTGKRTWRDAVKPVLLEKLRKDGFVLDVQEIGDKEELSKIESKKYD